MRRLKGDKKAPVTIREILKILFERSGKSQTDIARAMGCKDSSQFNKLLHGGRKWHEKWIDKFLAAIEADASIPIDKDFKFLPESQAEKHRKLQRVLDLAKPEIVTLVDALLEGALQNIDSRENSAE